MDAIVLDVELNKRMIGRCVRPNQRRATHQEAQTSDLTLNKQ